MSTLFLMWYDDNPKLTVARKIEDAMGAYRNRFSGTAPTLVLVNEEDVTEVAGVQVRGVTTVRRNTVWVGLDRERHEGILDRERHEGIAEDANANVANVVNVANVANVAKPRKRAAR
jgi:hypothetical protein